MAITTINNVKSKKELCAQHLMSWQQAAQAAKRCFGDSCFTFCKRQVSTCRPRISIPACESQGLTAEKRKLC